jgi:hypothetical protein
MSIDSARDATAPALRTIRRSALYDLIVTAPFATPWTARWLVDALGALHDTLGLSGQRPVLVGAIAILLANLMGSLVVIWSLVRLRAPTLDHGATDSLARGVFSLWMAYAILAGGSPLLLGFLVAEVAWGVVQLRAVRAGRKLTA